MIVHVTNTIYTKFSDLLILALKANFQRNLGRDANRYWTDLMLHRGKSHYDINQLES